MGQKTKQSLAVWLAVFLAAPALLASDKNDPDKIGKRDVGKGINFYSIEKEISLGKAMAEDIERDSKLLDDPVINEYVNRLGQNLVRNSDAKVPFTIKVINSEEVNAFALPGGFFFVNSGLILKADSEAELAGVMAHEIAHVAARHGTRQASRGHLINYGSIPLIFIGGWAGYAVRQAASLAIPLGFLQFSRSFEREADMLGLQYLYKSGYDPVAFVDFFEKIQAMEKKKPGAVADVFSSHPMTGKRIKAAQKEIQEDLKPQQQYVVDTSEFQKVKSRLEWLQNRRRGDYRDMNRPVLHRSPSAGKDDSGEDGRPTLKRR
ncbi:MAG: M48 family metallopeptidase [Rhodospirillales bacterium]